MHAAARGLVRRRSSGHGMTRRCTQLGAHICFRETNPFYFRDIFDASLLPAITYAVCSGIFKRVRSPKTNPFFEVFGAVFERNEPILAGCTSPEHPGDSLLNHNATS